MAGKIKKQKAQENLLGAKRQWASSIFNSCLTIFHFYMPSGIFLSCFGVLYDGVFSHVEFSSLIVDLFMISGNQI